MVSGLVDRGWAELDQTLLVCHGRVWYQTSMYRTEAPASHRPACLGLLPIPSTIPHAHCFPAPVPNSLSSLEAALPLSSYARMLVSTVSVLPILASSHCLTVNVARHIQYILTRLPHPQVSYINDDPSTGARHHSSTFQPSPSHLMLGAFDYPPLSSQARRGCP